jgi:hypothetical protein
MARNYILGGMGATQLQAGKPYFKRIVRIDSSSGLNRHVASGAKHPDSEGYTCDITAAGEIKFSTSTPTWVASGNRNSGELLMVEFPTTMRNVEINLEESWVGSVDNTDPENPVNVTRKQTAGQGQIRLKVMLTAQRSTNGQKTHFFDADGNPDASSPIAKPIENGNYIEVMQGETATISSRTKVVFILIQKFAADDILAPANGFVNGTGAAANAEDAVSILITGVLDHEPTSGGSQASNEPNSKVIESDNTTTRTLRKIWGKGDGVG